MKRLNLIAVIAGALFFSVESATAQENQNNQSQTATEQTQQKDFEQIEAQDLPDEVRQALERDYEGATVAEAYSKEKDGEAKYKIVVNTQDGESKELYADAQGNWIDKEKEKK